MSKQKLSQDEIDKIVVAGRVVSKPSMCGVGTVDVDFQTCQDGKLIWQYKLWINMLSRCFRPEYKEAHQTYELATVCDEWLSFANFLGWCNKEVAYNGKPDGMSLDKDLIIRGNKTYSPEACSFVPKPINNLTLSSAAARGLWPVGVTYRKRDGRFVAKLNCHGRTTGVGYFDCPQEAFQAYKIAKEAQIKVVALQYKNMLKPAVFESLMGWEIEP